ncbi:hypothetical protein [Methylobacter sp.]|uniref:hypothetical protein n=1 Tax=Methylobacter sp. TaxID=2051955 RepID=UPI00120470A0|nr:hypothetical protein [Methylobacter sp.]TAK63524.1 MAG: hypothetical protein EPO18_06615 [Methylobacter sp.]
MKKIKLLLALSLLFGLSSLAVFADTLSSDKDLIGSWFLEYTKKSPEDSEKKPMGMTWVFSNNQLTQKDIPQVRGNPYDAPAVDYIVEDGNLKVSILGRAGKFDVYSLVEKTDTAMVLKDNKYGTYMYFTKK